MVNLLHLSIGLFVMMPVSFIFTLFLGGIFFNMDANTLATGGAAFFTLFFIGAIISLIVYFLE